ncbi:MAG: hypothetical protein JXQ75_21230 [Phycisphaerae bacterium]|nr:hypothetical protein [Phycisphaerae bacterium]
MTSDKQAEANRRNAQKSTGPKTPEGKAICSQNAVKHGLLSRDALLPAESEDAFLEFAKGMRADLKPVGPLESMLVDRVISSAWRLGRAVAVEGDMFKRTCEDRTYGPLGDIGDAFMVRGRIGNAFTGDRAFANLSRYETAIERGLFRALKELRALQAERQNGSVS